MGIVICWELSPVEEDLWRSVTASWKGSMDMENLRSFKIKWVATFPICKVHQWGSG